MQIEPYLIDFGKIITNDKGALSVFECKQVPFKIKRVFWAYNLPNTVTRGYHAHRRTSQVLVALNGIITVRLEDVNSNNYEFILEDPQFGLYIPPHFWHTMTYEGNALQLVMASHEYLELDYLRNHNDFVEYWKNNL